VRGNIIAVANQTLNKVEGEETSSDAQKKPLESQNTFQKSSTDSQKATLTIGSMDIEIPKEKIEQKTNSELSQKKNEEIQTKKGVTSKIRKTDIKTEIPIDEIKQRFNSESRISESDEKEELNKEKQIEEGKKIINKKVLK